MRVCVFYVFQYTLIDFSPKNMKYLLELREFQFQMRNSVQLESLHNSDRSRKPHVHVAGRMQHFLGKWKHLIHVPSILNAVIFFFIPPIQFSIPRTISNPEIANAIYRILVVVQIIHMICKMMSFHYHKLCLLDLFYFKALFDTRMIFLPFHIPKHVNPYPFIYLKPEKGTPFGQSLPV